MCGALFLELRPDRTLSFPCSIRDLLRLVLQSERPGHLLLARPGCFALPVVSAVSSLCSLVAPPPTLSRTISLLPSGEGPSSLSASGGVLLPGRPASR